MTLSLGQLDCLCTGCWDSIGIFYLGPVDVWKKKRKACVIHGDNGNCVIHELLTGKHLIYTERAKWSRHAVRMKPSQLPWCANNQRNCGFRNRSRWTDSIKGILQKLNSELMPNMTGKLGKQKIHTYNNKCYGQSHCQWKKNKKILSWKYKYLIHKMKSEHHGKKEIITSDFIYTQTMQSRQHFWPTCATYHCVCWNMNTRKEHQHNVTCGCLWLRGSEHKSCLVSRA